MVETVHDLPQGVRSVTDSAISAPKRLLRILIGGTILATAWIAIDLITQSQSASAAEVGDVTPSGYPTPVSDIVSPLVDRVTSIAAQVSAEPVSSVTHTEAVVEHSLSAIISNSLVLIGPVVETLTAPLADVVDALPPIPQLPVLASAGVVLPGDRLDVALAASNTPLLPTPVNSVPRDLPAVPAPPASADQLASPAAVLSSAFLAPPGSALSLRAVAGGIPLSPIYGFDTTPD
jgi:hypothetical protein